MNDVNQLAVALGTDGSELPEECCARCLYARPSRQPNGAIDFSQRECRERSPQVTGFLLMQPPRKPGGQPEQMVLNNAAWPVVPSKEWCGKFKRQVQEVN